MFYMVTGHIGIADKLCRETAIRVSFKIGLF